MDNNSSLIAEQAQEITHDELADIHVSHELVNQIENSGLIISFFRNALDQVVQIIQTTETLIMIVL